MLFIGLPVEGTKSYLIKTATFMLDREHEEEVLPVTLAECKIHEAVH